MDAGRALELLLNLYDGGGGVDARAWLLEHARTPDEAAGWVAAASALSLEDPRDFGARGAERAAIELERQIFVTVQEFGVQPVSATVEAYLDGRLVGVRSAEIGPEAIVLVDVRPRVQGEALDLRFVPSVL